MFQPQATIIADSINPVGDRLTTMVIQFHRFILPEVNTHRMLSKNTSSSRAIPVNKLLEQVEEIEAYPLFWGANCKGMSAKQELSEQDQRKAKMIWRHARLMAVTQVKALMATGESGVHKQTVNRLLEPFLTTTMIISGTNQPSTWQNLFNQRCHESAQPEFKALADAMKAAYDASKPDLLQAGEWHLPFIELEERQEWKNGLIDVATLIKVLTGRCARVSYLNHDGKRDIMADIKLHDRLLSSTPPHLSPFEHVAQALGKSEARANFTGFESYRFQLERERQIAREILQPTEQAAKAMKEIGL
jgi:thymidylate synthase ThyX